MDFQEQLDAAISSVDFGDLITNIYQSIDTAVLDSLEHSNESVIKSVVEEYFNQNPDRPHTHALINNVSHYVELQHYLKTRAEIIRKIIMSVISKSGISGESDELPCEIIELYARVCGDHFLLSDATIDPKHSITYNEKLWFNSFDFAINIPKTFSPSVMVTVIVSTLFSIAMVESGAEFGNRYSYSFFCEHFGAIFETTPHLENQTISLEIRSEVKDAIDNFY